MYENKLLPLLHLTKHNQCGAIKMMKSAGWSDPERIQTKDDSLSCILLHSIKLEALSFDHQYPPSGVWWSRMKKNYIHTRETHQLSVPALSRPYAHSFTMTRQYMHVWKLMYLH